MEQFFEDYYDRLDSIHKQVRATIEELPAAAFDWKPGPSMNSLTVLIVHLTGAEKYWICDVAGDTHIGRDRAAEFLAAEWDAAALQARITETRRAVKETLVQLTLDDLAAQRESITDGEQTSVAWALQHALEHSALHLGHIQLTRQLWENKESQTS